MHQKYRQVVIKSTRNCPNCPNFGFCFIKRAQKRTYFQKNYGHMPKNSKLRLLQPEAEGHGKSNLQAGMQSAPGDHQSIVCIGRKSVMLVPFPFRLCFRQEVINENMYTENVFKNCKDSLSQWDFHIGKPKTIK